MWDQNAQFDLKYVVLGKFSTEKIYFLLRKRDK